MEEGAGFIADVRKTQAVVFQLVPSAGNLNRLCSVVRPGKERHARVYNLSPGPRGGLGLGEIGGFSRQRHRNQLSLCPEPGPVLRNHQESAACKEGLGKVSALRAGISTCLSPAAISRFGGFAGLIPKWMQYKESRQSRRRDGGTQRQRAARFEVQCRGPSYAPMAMEAQELQGDPPPLRTRLWAVHHRAPGLRAAALPS